MSPRADSTPAADRSTPRARARAEREIGERWLSFAASIAARNPARAARLAAVGRLHLAEAVRELAAAKRKDHP